MGIPIKRIGHTARIALCTMIGASFGGAATSAGPTPPSDDALTLLELMDGRVDPAADALWDSVAFIASTSGEEDRRPQTPAQWQELRLRALQLMRAANHLQRPGLQVGGMQRIPGPGELAPAEIQKRLDASHDVFAQKARNLGRTARKALASIDARDADALMAAGGLIDNACEACHVIYWYPDQASSRR